jgi:histidyl-tRNA synthetase
LEKTALFVRGVGEDTDIVGKEMYTFEDRGGDAKSGTMVSLRPEGTAPAVRAAIEHNLFAQESLVRWFYAGPMFRRERQQKGRYRQFMQVGAEIYGASTAMADAELLDAGHQFLSELGIGQISLEINSLGDEICRPQYIQALIAYLQSHGPELCADCQRRLQTNPLRILDCKNENCKKITEQSPVIDTFLCAACSQHFSAVRDLLDGLNIPYAVNPRIVRGLDYYTRTVFEFVSRAQGEGGLGSQNTVCAGGRYDRLVKSLGGPDVPAIGFAAGVERLAILMAAQEQNNAAEKAPLLFLVTLDTASGKRALQIASELRKNGLAVDIDLRSGGLKSQMRRADKKKARFAMVLGESELTSGQGKLKEMATGQELLVSLDNIQEALKAFL